MTLISSGKTLHCGTKALYCWFPTFRFDNVLKSTVTRKRIQATLHRIAFLVTGLGM